MKKPMNENGKISDQYILFLIDEDDKKIHLEVSANKEPVAVLRKHWRGDDPDTRAVFSKENPKAKPVMRMWYAGKLTRRKAKTFLMEWEQLFTAAGYEIVGSKISYSFRQNPPELSGIEKFAFHKIKKRGLRLSFLFGASVLIGLFKNLSHTNGFSDFRASNFPVFTSLL